MVNKTILAPAALAIMVLGLATLCSQSIRAQAQSRQFPETGKTVKGKFFTYWQANGGLAQQGYPISEEMQEESDTDGKVYLVQYFERAVFEMHPENKAPFDVLLSLLGNQIYGQKYPNGAPNQKASAQNPRLYAETGKTVGGVFRAYWERNGGLAQQGYPISEEFQERNELDGKTYTVQYFERAVFEFHPENQAPFNVLLSQLGTFRYKALYGTGNPPPAPATPVPPTPVAAKPGWSQVAALNAGPSGRYDGSALVDPVRNNLVIFGGRGSGAFGDTWIFNMATRMWREVKGAGPQPRFGQGTVYDPANRRMLVVMGEGSGFFNDVWAFDLDKETWAQLKATSNNANAPRTRYGQSAVLDSRGRVIISHGFSDQGRFDDTWAFDPKSNEWVNITPTAGPKPLKRCLHEMAYDAAADKMYLFGGCSSGFGPCPQGDLWVLDLKTNRWSELAPGGVKPSPRSNPSLSYNAAKGELVLFGGQAGRDKSAETWSYNITKNAWAKSDMNGPGPRSSQATAPDSTGKRMVIFGGQAPAGPNADVWVWGY